MVLVHLLPPITISDDYQNELLADSAFVTKDAISLELVGVVPNAKVRCIQGKLAFGFVVKNEKSLDIFCPHFKRSQHPGVCCIQGSLYLAGVPVAYLRVSALRKL